MATTHTDADYMSAPKDYADIFRLYYPYIVNLCGRFGIDENNKEDVASEIFLRFMERGSLEKFDPDLNFEYKGQFRPARFKSYLSRAVEIYSRGHRDKQHKLSRREVQICDIDFSVNAKEGSTAAPADQSWVEIYGEHHADHAEEVLDMVCEETEAENVRNLLRHVPKRSPHDTCDLVALYNAARIQILTTGTYDIKILKAQFHVGTTAMHSWMWWLKENLAHIYGRPTPAKRPRAVRPA